MQKNKMDICYNNYYKTMTSLKMFLHKMPVAEWLLPPDFEKQRHYCEYLLRKLHSDLYIQDQTLYSDELWFYLMSCVNPQNIHLWSEKNPHAVCGTAIHPVKIGP
jgi:hypothetical protein